MNLIVKKYRLRKLNTKWLTTLPTAASNTKILAHHFYFQLKGLFCIISSDLPFKEGYPQFTTVSLKPLHDHILFNLLNYASNCFTLCLQTLLYLKSLNSLVAILCFTQLRVHSPVSSPRSNICTSLYILV